MTMPHPLRLDDQLNVVLDAARNCLRIGARGQRAALRVWNLAHGIVGIARSATL